MEEQVAETKTGSKREIYVYVVEDEYGLIDVTPTRALARQVKKDAKQLGIQTKIKQYKAIKEVH